MDSRGLGLHECTNISLGELEMFELNHNIVEAGKLEADGKFFLLSYCYIKWLYLKITSMFNQVCIKINIF